MEGLASTYNDRDGRRPRQNLLHQSVSIVQRLHDLPLAICDLELDTVHKE